MAGAGVSSNNLDHATVFEWFKDTHGVEPALSVSPCHAFDFIDLPQSMSRRTETVSVADLHGRLGQRSHTMQLPTADELALRELWEALLHALEVSGRPFVQYTIVFLPPGQLLGGVAQLPPPAAGNLAFDDLADLLL